MLEIYLLEQLAAFAKFGTLSKAAEVLHISQPALSRSMKKLEEELGVKLFIRENKKLLLNETGALAAALAQSQVNQNKEMVNRIIAFDRNLHSIHIGACAPQPMAELMPILQDHFGDMTISSELVYGEKLLNGLENGVYQLAILQAPAENDEIFCQRYIEEHLYVALPKEHRLAKQNSVKFSDLVGEKFLLYQHIGFWKSVCEEYMKDTAFL
ncbi:MAG: LysR family transcriptional regulator, partial [Ruminococcus sp.]|nr:LysR family transcriptional regulator [Ruminococcus sp.]